MPEVASFRVDREPGGLFWRLLRLLRRNVAGAIANWLEQQGGFPLFTIEGDEPEPADLSWALPRSTSKGASSSGLTVPADRPGFLPLSDDGQSSTDLESEGSSPLEVPNFLMTTKFFACLDLTESQQLFEMTTMVRLAPHEVLFCAGESGESGIYIVIEGSLDLFLEDGSESLPTSSLCSGESVGDLDVLDGGARSVTALGGAQGALLVQVSRPLFIEFVIPRPRTLQIYLQKAMARLWRVAHFVLSDVLDLPLEEVLRFRSNNRLAQTGPTASYESLIEQPSSVVRGPRASAGVCFTPGDSAAPRVTTEIASGPTRSRQGSPNEGTMAGSTGAGMSVSGRRDSGPLGPGVGRGAPPGRTASVGIKAQRFQPQLAPVTENRLGSDALSLSSSLASEITDAGSMEGNTSKPVLSPFEAASWEPEPDSPREHNDAAFSFHPWGRLGTDSQRGSMTADDSVSLPGSLRTGPADSMATSVASAISSQSWASLAMAEGSQGEARSQGAAQAYTPFASAACVQGQEDDEDGGSFLSPAASLDESSSLKSSPMSSMPLDSMRSSSLALPPHVRASRSQGNGTIQQLPPVHTSVTSSGQNGKSLLTERMGSMQTATGSALSSAFADALQDASSRIPGADKKTSSGQAVGNGLTADEGLTPVGLTRGSLDSPVARHLDDVQGLQPDPPRASPTSGGLGGLESRRSLIFGQKPQDTRLDDASVVSDIARTMNRLQTMSMPVQLLRSYSSPAPPPLKIQEPYRAPKGALKSQGPVCSRSTPLYRTGFLDKPHAALQTAWDVVSVEEGQLSDTGWSSLCCVERALGQHIRLEAGRVLHRKDDLSRQFYLVLEGHLLAERPRKGSMRQEVALVAPGSLLNCAAFISSTRARMSLRAVETCHLVALGPTELEKLVVDAPDVFLELLLLAAQALGPVVRKFISLGLTRQWLTAGSTVFRQGEEARSLYMVISGRLRLLREEPTNRPPVVVEDEASRGESVGAVWALSGGAYDTTALCVRDSELVRMSKGAFEIVSTHYPKAAARMLEAMAKRLAAASAARARPNQVDVNGRVGVTASDAARSQMDKRRKEIVTIALLPAGASPGASAAIRKFGTALKSTLEELFGPTLHLMHSGMEMTFPGAFERIHIGFYRSKITSWMAAQEEEYRFIILEADTTKTPWSRICVSHADCVLLVGAEDGQPDLNHVEQDLVWAPMGPALEKGKSLDLALGASLLNPYGLEPELASEADGLQNAQRWAAHMRRVELVLLHPARTEPHGTSAWLGSRPHLARHHHVRLSHSGDLARVARWMAGKAVGVVLSGGGSRGLAHLGVLNALDSAGVPIDVIGGTSQGAFMAALYAQGLAWDEMHSVIRTYAKQMGSVHQLVTDITLPLISLFSGAGFNRVVRESMSHGPQQIEDLWLRFFCMTTNLSRGEPTAHDRGLLWKLVRASMTIVGLVPPVYEDGQLLVDGGYLNNIPVDVMRSMGVDMVVVVDVEDKDMSLWQDLTPYENGVSGWRLLWDRWCPIPSLRFGIKMPSYNQIISALTWMSHTQNLRRMSREYLIDLYLHPPVSRFRILDYHLMDRIVRDSNRYAWAALSEWQVRRGVTQKGMFKMEAPQNAPQQPKPLVIRRSYSVACMTQLQAKQMDVFGAASDDTDETGEADPSEGELDGDVPAAEQALLPADPAPAEADSQTPGGQAGNESSVDALPASPRDNSGDDAPLAEFGVNTSLLQDDSAVTSVGEEGHKDDDVLEVSDVSMCGFAASGVVSPRTLSPLRRSNNARAELLDKRRGGKRVSFENPAVPMAGLETYAGATSGFKDSLPLLSTIGLAGRPGGTVTGTHGLSSWPGSLVEDVSTASLALSGLTGPASTPRHAGFKRAGENFEGVVPPDYDSVVSLLSLGRRNSLYPQHASGSLGDLMEGTDVS